jgi:hypothetical protein
LPDIDAQRHRRGPLVGQQDGLPVLGPVTAQTLDPPGRVVPARLRQVIGSGLQGIALPQEAAQAGVEKVGLWPG